MASTRKHRAFVAEPMGKKSMRDLPGIGEAQGRRLEDQGFDKAYMVLSQFLVLKKDEELFKEWLKATCHANDRQCKECHTCLREWCDAFI